MHKRYRAAQPGSSMQNSFTRGMGADQFLKLSWNSPSWKAWLRHRWRHRDDIIISGICFL